MGRADYFELGDYNAVCSECGRKRKASTMERNWQGLYRCSRHNEQRQPQDFVRAIPDIMTVPWAQLPQDAYTDYCSFNGCSAVANYAVAGCMIASRSTILPADETNIPQGTWTGAF